MRNNMLLKSIVILCFIFIATIFILFKYCFHMDKAEAPAKPSSVPALAVWRGDFDEGFWIEHVPTDGGKDKYRFKIYNDYDGKLAYDGVFCFSDKQCSQIKWPKEIIDSVLYFSIGDTFKIVMKNSCECKAVPPQLGGYFLK